MAPSSTMMIEAGRQDLYADLTSADLVPTLTTVGLVSVGTLLALLVVEIVRYLTTYFGATQRFNIPATGEIVDGASDAWLNREHNFIGNAIDPYVSQSRALQDTVFVLDNISTAWLKWGEEATNAIRDTLY